jgi:hypothetical protein
MKDESKLAWKVGVNIKIVRATGNTQLLCSVHVSLFPELMWESFQCLHMISCGSLLCHWLQQLLTSGQPLAGSSRCNALVPER